jgi:hypothetical protein
MNTPKVTAPNSDCCRNSPCQAPFSDNPEPGIINLTNKDAVELARKFGFNNDFKRFNEQDIALIDRLALKQEVELFEFAWKEVVVKGGSGELYKAINAAGRPISVPGDIRFSDSAHQIQSRINRDVAEKIGWLQGLISKRKLLLGL